MVLFYAAFTTYYLYPAAPPWLAAQLELIPPVSRVLINTLQQFPASAPLALLYQYFSPNDVAAVPSLHGAAPMLLALVAFRLWGWKALGMFVYPLLAGISFVYLGEHYVADILAGWVYALVAFLAVWTLAPPVGRLIDRWLHQYDPHWRLRRLQLPSWPLAFLALSLIVLVWIDPFYQVPLHPETGPVIPGAGVRAGVIEASRVEDLQPAACDEGAAASLIVDRALEAYASQYGAYLHGLGSGACLTIVAAPTIPPLLEGDLSRVDWDRSLRAPDRLRLPDEPPGYLTLVQAGKPVDDLERWTGAPADERYVLVVRVDNVDHQNEVRQVVSQLAQILFEPDVARQ
jgi:hypothetical protein